MVRLSLCGSPKSRFLAILTPTDGVVQFKRLVRNQDG